MRNVTDTGDRVWACTQEGVVPAEPIAGQDVFVLCSTPTVPKPVRLKIGWQWHTKLSDNGLARMIVLAAPVPRR
jgi:hypothetical protein